MDVFSASGRHMVCIDVVEFTVGTQSEAGCYGNDSGPPQRFEEFDVRTCEIADKAERADYLIVLHRLGKEAARVRSTQADSGLPSGRDGAGHTLIQQPAENHHGDVSGFAISDPQAVDEPALDAHAFERASENLSATMDYQQFVSLMGKLRNLSAQ